MGMFDTVVAKCPKCCAEIQIQSKAGPCELNHYSIHSVPPEIAASILGEEVWCEWCGTKFKVEAYAPIARVRLNLVSQPMSRSRA